MAASPSVLIKEDRPGSVTNSLNQPHGVEYRVIVSTSQNDVKMTSSSKQMAMNMDLLMSEFQKVILIFQNGLQ